MRRRFVMKISMPRPSNASNRTSSTRSVAAFDERPVRVCREIARRVQGAATIIGTTRKTSPDLAAFANGAASRYYDLNDIYVGKVTSHPSDHIAPCIAVAEAERASAHDLITAIALA